MLKIHEITTSQGELASVFLKVDDGALVIASDEGSYDLPRGALDNVMARYGMPLEPSACLRRVAALELGDGSLLHHVRHLPRYDVISRDYLVHDAPGREPLCALATTVAAALDHLARAARSVS